MMVSNRRILSIDFEVSISVDISMSRSMRCQRARFSARAIVLLCLAANLDAAPEPGFLPLFNGNDLDGWTGSPEFWRVENGAIVGETSETLQPKDGKNTFLIYEDDSFDDFELRFEYRVDGFNSGVQYRSVADDQWHVRGLQADFEAQWHNDGTVDRFSGMFFEEGGRMFMGQRGDVVIVRANPEEPKKPQIEKIGSVGAPEELETVIRRDDWNDYTVIANGNQFLHMINGRAMSIGIDEDQINHRKSGVLAFQLHSGNPMKIQVRNLRIRRLP